MVQGTSYQRSDSETLSPYRAFNVSIEMPIKANDDIDVAQRRSRAFSFVVWDKNCYEMSDVIIASFTIRSYE